jgi:hypothetical protein
VDKSHRSQVIWDKGFNLYFALPSEINLILGLYFIYNIEDQCLNVRNPLDRYADNQMHGK